jgi:hypothetical protein
MNRDSAAYPSDRPIPAESATSSPNPTTALPPTPVGAATAGVGDAGDLQPSVTVVVRGFQTICWRCRKPTTCVVAVHAQACQHSEEWVRSDWARRHRWLPLDGGHRALADTQAALELLHTMASHPGPTAARRRRPVSTARTRVKEGASP